MRMMEITMHIDLGRLMMLYISELGIAFRGARDSSLAPSAELDCIDWHTTADEEYAQNVMLMLMRRACSRLSGWGHSIVLGYPESELALRVSGIACEFIDMFVSALERYVLLGAVACKLAYHDCSADAVLAPVVADYRRRSEGELDAIVSMLALCDQGL